MSQPVRYTPSVEMVEPDEGETIRGLEEQFRQILDTTSADYGTGVRSVHAKAHGLMRGTLTVAADLSPELAQGIFAQGGKHEAILRISTNPGDLLDDSIGLPRGAALKVLGVSGDRLPGSEDDSTQDFIMVNGPVFTAPDAKAFLKNLTLLAKTTDKGEGAKKVLSGLLRGAEATLEMFGGESATLQQLGGAKPSHPLGQTYYSQTPYRFGDHIAKFALFPVSKPLIELAEEIVNTSGRPDALREDVNEVMAVQGGRWELRVQLNTDLDTMPVEDPTVQWDETASPFRTVATLDMPPQISWQPMVSENADKELSYSPWHGITAHQPLGGINRARRDPYKFSADYRGRVNGCPMHEPRSLQDITA